MNSAARPDPDALMRKALAEIQDLRSQLRDGRKLGNEPIAIIGMACRFPGGDTPEAFFEFLLNGGDGVGEIPKDRWDIDAVYDPDPDVPGKMYMRRAAFLKDVDQFAASFFGISPREAQFMDPQQRLLLEVNYEALENAGVAPDRLAGKQVGVFVGMGTSDYGDLKGRLGAKAVDAYDGTGGSHAAAAGRLSYFLGVRGPSLAVDTACSSSLVSVHLAVNSLRSGECELALASGVSLNYAPDVFVSLCKARMLSPDGRCATFDAKANGYARGEGCGAVTLKRLSDAIADGDRIMGVIRGSAANHNGRSSSLTVPSGTAQQEVVRTALRNGGLQPGEVSYLEAHGTGTPVGDPIELGALGAVFAGRSQPLLIGSVKTNTGHLEWAAGVCGLVKLVMSIRDGRIPANLHFDDPNPMVPWDRLPLKVIKQTTPWPPGPRIGGVSSFGFGGSNAHVVVEAAPDVAFMPSAGERPLHMLCLSAKSADALRLLAGRYAEQLESLPDADVPHLTYSAHVGRSHFPLRLSIAGKSAGELAAGLKRFAAGDTSPLVNAGQTAPGGRRIAMMFTGQGSQRHGMGRQLYDTQPTFKAALDQCDALLRAELEIPLLQVLYGTDETLIHQTAYTQPALFALEWSLAQLWRAWGIEPEVVLGHSVGEYAAACIAGVFSLADAIPLIAARGRLMQALPTGGKMAAVRADEAQLVSLLTGYERRVSIAAVNGPRDLVISGEGSAIDAILAKLKDTGVAVHPLTVSHAFHSALMEPMLNQFEAVARTVTYNSPTLTLVSNLTSGEVGNQVTDPAYWVQHVRATVRFGDGIAAAAALGCDAFIEVGPQAVLAGMGRQGLPAQELMWLPSLSGRKDDWSQMLESLSSLYLAGHEIDWVGFDADYARRKLALPNYPFERQRYWFSGHAAATASALRPLVETLFASPLVEQTVASTGVGISSLPYLADHRVFGQVVVPGAAYLSMLASVGDLMAWPSSQLNDVMFVAPLALEDSETRTLQAVLTPDPDQTERESFGVELVSLAPDQPDDAPQRHVLGRLSKASDSAQLFFDLAPLQARCPTPVGTDALYATMINSGIDLGPRFRWVEDVWLGEREALARLVPPADIGDLEGYVVHPGLIDACFPVAGATLSDEDAADALLPFSVRSLRFAGPAGAGPWLCHAQMAGELLWDISLMDAAGRLIAKFEGFQMRKASAAAFGRRRHGDWVYRIDWQPQRLEPVEAAMPADWLLVGGQDSAIAMAITRALTGRGDQVSQVFELADVMPCLQLALARETPITGLINLQALDQGTDDFAADAQRLCEGSLSLAQALLQIGGGTRLWTMTNGASAFRPGDEAQPAHAALWAMGRSLAAETPQLGPVLIDIDHGQADDIAAFVLTELDLPPGESQIALRAGERFVARLARCPEAIADPIIGPVKLQLADYGGPDQLRIVPTQHSQPSSDQVQISVRASALNFRDVLISLGMLKDYYAEHLGIATAQAVPLGFDCAGVVTAIGDAVSHVAVGDEVMAAWAGGAASSVTAFRELVVRKPKALSPEEASAVPSVFWTGWHGLKEVAQLKSGERVLIHAAAGGVGLAAIQVAMATGAEVFATASPGKWDYLKSIGVTHIMHSRTLDFAEEILKATDGQGVDVVLNSLSGPAIEKSFKALKIGGRFIEIGKLGIWSPQEAKDRRPDATYHAFDLGEAADADPPAFLATLEAIREAFDAGVLKALPQVIYPLERAADAYRYVQQTRQIGKVVLSFAGAEATPIRPDASYLITGGLGGLGLAVAERLVAEGARCLVLAGRSPPGEEAQAAIARLQDAGATVLAVSADVSRPEDVARLITTCEALAPLRGVVHAAGLLRDGVVQNQTAERLAEVMGPKAVGAWNLHHATLSMSLDIFVAFASLAGLIGSPGQANYSAANGFLDGLMYHRRAAGLPGVSIDWGPWDEVGMAASLKSGGGVDKMDVAGALEILAALIVQPIRAVPAQVAAMRVRWDTLAQSAGPELLAFISPLLRQSPHKAAAAADDILPRLRAASPEERLAMLKSHVNAVLLQILGLEASHDVAHNQSWRDLGVDSLMMVEIKNRLDHSLGVALSMESLAEDTTDRLAAILLESLGDLSAEPVALSPAARPKDETALWMQALERGHSLPQAFRTADDQKQRQVLIDGRWRIDLASCNYLGFDLDPEIAAAISPAVAKWGTHPSWTRAVASPSLYSDLERELAQMVGAADTLVFPSISLLHMGVLPVLAGFTGVIFKDVAAHHSINEACLRARAEGVDCIEFRHNDVAGLAERLARVPAGRAKVIATDGVYSMGSANPPLAKYVRLAKEFDATVYVDDAHGFGILGERPDAAMPYGFGGNGIVRHLGLSLTEDPIVFVAGLSKAFSSYAAFVTCADPGLKAILQATGPYVFSGPTSVASLATALAGLDWNRQVGDQRRATILRLTRRLVTAARDMGFEVDNDADFPIVGVVMGSWERMSAACALLWEHGILITPATFPATPIDRNLVRFSITAANTDAQIEVAIKALHAVRNLVSPEHALAAE